MDEATQASAAKQINTVLAGWLPEHAFLYQQVDELERLIFRGEAAAVIKALCAMVPTFRPMGLLTTKSLPKAPNGTPLPHSLPVTLYST